MKRSILFFTTLAAAAFTAATALRPTRLIERTNRLSAPGKLE